MTTQTSTDRPLTLKQMLLKANQIVVRITKLNAELKLAKDEQAAVKEQIKAAKAQSKPGGNGAGSSA